MPGVAAVQQTVEAEEPVAHGPGFVIAERSAEFLFVDPLQRVDVFLRQWHCVHLHRIRVLKQRALINVSVSSLGVR